MNDHSADEINRFQQIRKWIYLNHNFVYFLIGSALAFLLVFRPFDLIHYVSNLSDRMAAEIYAKEAITERFTYLPEEIYEEHIQRVCSVSHEIYCEQYKDDIVEIYYDFPKQTSCHIDFIEPIAAIKFDELKRKGVSLRVSYTMYDANEQALLHEDCVVLMIKDKPWKLFDLISHEEYAEELFSE